jgi:zinc transporter 9
VGTFFVGGVCAVYNGIGHFISPGELVSPQMALYVLGFSFVAEGATFAYAANVLHQAAKQQGITLRQYLKVMTDPMAVTVLLEDGASLVGIIIAGVALGLTHLTGLQAYDAGGSILIGGLLGAVASFLIRFNRDLLVGKAMQAEKLQIIVNLLQNDKIVTSLRDVKGMNIGAERMRFKAEIRWNGAAIAAQTVQAMDLEKAIKELKTRDDLEKFLTKFGAEIVGQMGKEVDRLEAAIKAAHPEVRHVDLESD